MAVRWKEEFEKLHPKVRVEVSAGGAGKGMADVLGGLVDIGMVSRDVDPSEIEKGAYPIGVTKDAVVAKTWGEVVGKPEKKQEIHVYTRSDAAGAPEIWAKYLGKKHESLKGTGFMAIPDCWLPCRKTHLV